MKARFIFNPHSGSNRRNPYLRDRATAFIKERGLDATLVSTERPRHATELARQAVADGCGLVVAIGGDGTMNEVASALVDTPAVFGLIPCGSGNGLGRHVGIRKPNHGAFDTLLNGRPLPIDTGLVNGFAFFNAMGLGFEADIAVRFSRLTNRGLTGYVRNLPDRSVEIVVDADQETFEQFLAAIKQAFAGNISNVEITTVAAGEEFSRFEIRHG